MKSRIFFLIFFILQFTLIAAAARAKPVNSENDPAVIISASWLKEYLSDPSLVIFHVGGQNTFDAGHIPRAQFVSLMDFMVMKSEAGLWHEFVDENPLVSRLRKLGVNDNSSIVLYYDDARYMPATARIFLTLDYYGIGKNVLFLNGGLIQWKTAGYDISTATSAPTEGNVTAKKKDHLLVDTDWAKQNLENPAVIFIDGRPEDHYLGKSNPHDFPRSGHIEGAFNVPFYELVQEEKPYLFKDAGSLKYIFSAVGAENESVILAYCNTGFWAPQVYLIAKYLGYDVRFYDASFQAWSEDSMLPVIGQAGVR